MCIAPNRTIPSALGSSAYALAPDAKRYLLPISNDKDVWGLKKYIFYYFKKTLYFPPKLPFERTNYAINVMKTR